MEQHEPSLSGRIYIPDTSALIENPDALDRLLLDGNVVVLLHQVIEELGRLQSSRSKPEGVRHAARQVTRKILEYRRRSLIHQHVESLLSGEGTNEAFPRTPEGGILAWEPDGHTMPPYPEASGDNLILASARRVAEMVANNNGHARYDVVLVSEDSNLLLKSDAVGLAAEPLRFGKVELESVDQLEGGVVEIEVARKVIDGFLGSGGPGERWVDADTVSGDTDSELVWNTGVVLQDGERTVLARANMDSGRLEDLRFAQYWDRKREVYKPRPILGIAARDPAQTFAMEFLLDPKVQLVVLDGPAGSGKTRLMSTAALFLLSGQPTSVRVSRQSAPIADDPGYDNGLILLRPEHASSRYELGYLPGDFEAKMSPWLEPFFQAIRSLSILNDHDFMEELEATGRVTMISTSMLRGLDIERSVVLVDELQNGDRHLAKTLMSRFCATSKVVLAGCLDPLQIDNPYVDWRSNALTRVKETYRGFGPFVAQVHLRHNYRGPISTRADEL